MFSQTIKNEGYTLASMIRDELFHQGATFASCIVSHPQSYELDITIEGEEPKEILKSAIERSSVRLNACTQALDNFVIFSNLGKEMDVVEEQSENTKKTRRSTRSDKTTTNKSTETGSESTGQKKEPEKRKRRTRHSEE